MVKRVSRKFTRFIRYVVGETKQDVFIFLVWVLDRYSNLNVSFF